MSHEAFIRVQIALERHPKLLAHLFLPVKPGADIRAMRLRAEPKALMSSSFSSGEKVLIKVALDLWNDSGEATLLDLKRLDPQNLRNVCRALAWDFGDTREAGKKATVPVPEAREA